MKNSSFQIVKDETNKNIFTIQFYTPNKALIDSFIKTNIIRGAIISNNYKTVRFKANTVSHYYEKNKKRNTNINNSIRLLTSLTTQLNYLITHESLTFLGYNLKYLIVIDDTKFLFLGCELLKEINDNDMVFISSPFSLNDFFVSPELLEIKEIPKYIHYKTTYFSLAILLLFVLSPNEEIYNEYCLKYKDTEKIEEPIFILNKYLQSLPIRNTKLCWLLSRCLVEDSKERNILYI